MERCSIVDLLFRENGVAILKLPYNYMKMISLQNVMEKIINDSIVLYLFNILKLLCYYFCTFILFVSYFPSSASVLNCLMSQI